MFLAAEQTIGHRLLQLPYGTQPLLECLGILELGDLLELVDADDDMIAFFCAIFSGSCRISSMSLLLGFSSSDMEKSVIGSGPIEIFGTDRGKKQFDILQPFVHFRGGLFENGGRKGIVKIPVAATRENIEINDLQFVRTVPGETLSAPKRSYPSDGAKSAPYSRHAGNSTTGVPFLSPGR